MSATESPFENLGPLTTVYPQDPGCSAPIIRASGRTIVKLEYGLACTPAGRLDPITEPASSCYPPRQVSFVTDADLYDRLPVFSPGLSCPADFTSACTVIRDQDSDSRSYRDFDASFVFNRLKVGETAIACCPSGYSCNSLFEDLCTRRVSVGEVVSGITYDKDCNAASTAVTIDGRVNAVTASRVVLIHAASDTVGRGSGGSSSSGTPSSDGGASNDIDVSSGGLKIGGKIAVGVVIPLIVAAITVFSLWFRKRRQRRSQKKAARQGTDVVGPQSDEKIKPELEASPGVLLGGKPYAKPELDAENPSVSTDPAPLNTNGNSHELDQNTAAAEVEVVSPSAELPSPQGQETRNDERGQFNPAREPWRWAEPFDAVEAPSHSSRDNIESPGVAPSSELPVTTPPSELQAKSPPPELPSTPTASELPATSRSSQAPATTKEPVADMTLEELSAENERIEAQLKRMKDIQMLEEKRAEIQRKMSVMKSQKNQEP